MTPRRAGPGRVKDPRLALGRAAEDAAARHLEALGYEIIARNARFAGVEIDLVALDRGVTVFVEVRSRTHRRFGGPLETIDAHKRARIARGAGAFLSLVGRSDSPTRFDVVGVDWRSGGPHCTLVRGAFENHS
jgi:putative endonuclease